MKASRVWRFVRAVATEQFGVRLWTALQTLRGIVLCKNEHRWLYNLSRLHRGH